MIVYKYNNDGYYAGEHNCQVGIKGETLYPAGNYTEVKPTFEEGKITKWDGKKWIKIVDNRGKEIYNKETLQKIIWSNIEQWGNDYTDIVPPDITYSWSGNAWVEDSDKVAQKVIDDAKAELSQTDTGMIRVIEDLIDTLIDKNVIAINDLPVEAKDKINNRKILRDKIK